jgi:predicted esterase
VTSSVDMEELPPLYQAHGAKDPLVNPRWGASTHKLLKQLGVQGHYQAYSNLFHEINHKEIEALCNWIWRTLPEDLQDSQK